MFTQTERLIAVRNLRPKRKQGFLKIISLFSFLGIMLGVAILIIVMSVMNGFRSDLTDKIIGLNPHLILQFNNEKDLKNTKKILSTKYKNINMTESISGEGIILANNKAKGIFIKGISKKDKFQSFKKKKIIKGNLIERLRYGENPHQEGAIYSQEKDLKIKKIHGKQLSYNNYNDIFSALAISKTFPLNVGTVIIKHANPCGASIIKNNINSYKNALSCDPISAFGGIVSCNFKVSKNLAIELNKIFLEVIVANGFEKRALKILKSKKNLRLIDASRFSLSDIMKINSINNALLIQSDDKKKFSIKDFKIVSKKKPTKSQIENLIFAFNICRNVKSNAIVLANQFGTVGIGSGQPSRLDSCQLAINKMNKFQKSTDDLVAASDAFFPFVDGIEKLVQSGVSAIIQPAGSIRDKEIIKFANATDTVLIFSKTRHFKH